MSKKTTIEVLLVANGKGLQNTMTRAQRSIKAFNNQVGNGTKMMSAFNRQVVGLAGAFVGLQAIGQVGTMLEDASRAVYNLEASLKAANRQFSVGTADEWAESIERLSEKLRIYATSDIQNATARTVDMTKRLGLSSDQMERIIELTGDLSAGKTTLEGGIERVTAALRGEAEASEYLGLTLNEDYVKAWYAASEAHEKVWKELSDVEKAQIRYQVFLEQAIPLEGRAAESINTYAGAIALVKKEMSDGLGQNKELVESLKDIAIVLRDNADDLGAMAGAIARGAASVISFVAANKEMIIQVAKWSLIFGGAVKIIGSLVSLFRGLNAAWIVLTGSQIIPWLLRLRTAFLTVAAGTRILNLAFKGFILFAAADAVIKIGRLVGILWDWRKATKELAQAQADAKSQKDWIDPKIAAKLKEINVAMGTNYKTMDALFQAQKDGKVAYDSLTGTWVAGAKKMSDATKESANIQKQVTGKALDEMRAKYQKYASEVKRLQDEIAGRERSLAEQLRSLARTGMSDLGAWEDRKKEAEEYEKAAKKAADAGNFDEAVKLADKAKDAYADLNTEVKKGDEVLVSKGEALAAAMSGAERAGKLAVEILKAEQQAAHDAMEALKEKSGFQDLSKGMDEAERKWLENWKNMRVGAIRDIEKVEDRLVRIKDKEITIWINERVKKALGGPVGYRGGGKLGGYGGGDRIPAMLEAGEYIIRKEAVSKFGAGIFHALNSLRLPQMPKFAAGGSVGVAAAAGALPGNIYNLSVNFAGDVSPISRQTARQNAKMVLSELQKMHRGAS